MRKIKFRYFVPENNYMGYIDITDQLNTEYNHRMFQEYEIMQYTGLKDKNKKEIYEGDIVKGTHNKSKIGIYKVYFNENVLAWYILGEQGDIHLCDLEDCEIIGNIYENPELLTN